jgi:hypothetical protein
MSTLNIFKDVVRDIQTLHELENRLESLGKVGETSLATLERLTLERVAVIMLFHDAELWPSDMGKRHDYWDYKDDFIKRIDQIRKIIAYKDDKTNEGQ